MGRPSKYDTKFDKQAYKLALLGATDEELADFFEVATSTLYKWKDEIDSFSEAIKKGKDYADANVVQALYKRAIGYKHKEDKIFLHEGSPVIVPTIKRYPPDPMSCFYWLNNRKRGKWSQKVETENTEPLNIPNITNITIQYESKPATNSQSTTGSVLPDNKEEKDETNS